MAEPTDRYQDVRDCLSGCRGALTDDQYVEAIDSIIALVANSEHKAFEEGKNNLNLRIREALSVTKPWCEGHARHNLDGALIDIEHANGRADEICLHTIRRVIGQLAEVERILECADDLR